MEHFFNQYKNKLNRLIYELCLERCEGCELGLGNQEGHQCVMLSQEDMTVRYFRTAFDTLNKEDMCRDLMLAMEETILASCVEREEKEEESDANGVSSTTRKQ